MHRPRPAQYILPLVGLLLAQAIDGVSVGLSTLLHECVAGGAHELPRT